MKKLLDFSRNYGAKNISNKQKKEKRAINISSSLFFCFVLFFFSYSNKQNCSAELIFFLFVRLQKLCNVKSLEKKKFEKIKHTK